MTTLRLTYGQLAERTGRSLEAARLLARRRHWQIAKGNDGKAVVLIEEDELAGRPPVRPPGRPPVHDRSERPPDHPDGALVAELQQRIEGLEGGRVRAAAELMQARERAAKAEGQVVELHNALADLAGRLDKATAELTEARRPWLERLLAAMRG